MVIILKCEEKAPKSEIHYRSGLFRAFFPLSIESQNCNQAKHCLRKWPEWFAIVPDSCYHAKFLTSTFKKVKSTLNTETVNRLWMIQFGLFSQTQCTTTSNIRTWCQFTPHKNSGTMPPDNFVNISQGMCKHTVSVAFIYLQGYGWPRFSWSPLIDRMAQEM